MTEPIPSDIHEFLKHISIVHGPRRYQMGASLINGATTVVDGCNGWFESGKLEGSGAVYAWFVGSPRAFLFGFTRNQSWATRKMKYVMVNERDMLQHFS